MRIGKQDAPYSAICTSDADSITVRGRDLTGEIVGKMDFTSYFWLLVTGQAPNEDQAFFMNAILCALAEQGLVPSVVAARMTLAAAPLITKPIGRSASSVRCATRPAVRQSRPMPLSAASGQPRSSRIAGIGPLTLTGSARPRV